MVEHPARFSAAVTHAATEEKPRLESKPQLDARVQSALDADSQVAASVLVSLGLLLPQPTRRADRHRTLRMRRRINPPRKNDGTCRAKLTSRQQWAALAASG